MTIGIAATAALIIVGPGSTAAIAGRMIGSPAIKNNTVRSIDVRNGTIKGLDVKDGSLTAKDFSGTMRGAVGPRGKQGLRGPAGPAGAEGSAGTGGAQESIVTWQVHHQLDSNANGATIISSDVIPPDTQVEAVKFTINGDFGSCDGGVNLADTAVYTQLASMQWSSGTQRWSAPTLTGGGTVVAMGAPLRVSAFCYSGDQPVPTFDATITLALTRRDTNATGTFN